MTPELTDLCTRFLNSFVEGTDGLDADFTADAVVWHGTDGKEVPAVDAFKGIESLRGATSDLRIEVTKERGLDDGFLVQFELSGRGRASAVDFVSLHCIVAEVRDGRISRLDEYLDPSPLGRALRPPT